MPGQTCTYFQLLFLNVFYFNTKRYVCCQNPSNKNKDNVELRFYSVYCLVTCLTLPILTYIMYFSQVCMH